MLSKGTGIQKLKYYYLSSSSCFWISFMVITRIFKDNPKVCHISANFTACTWSLSFVCVNFWEKTNWLSFYTLPNHQIYQPLTFSSPRTQDGPWGLTISGKSWQEPISFKRCITLKDTRSKCRCDKKIQDISPAKLFQCTMYQPCCLRSQPQSTNNVHLQKLKLLKLLPVKWKEVVTTEIHITVRLHLAFISGTEYLTCSPVSDCGNWCSVHFITLTTDMQLATSQYSY